jgi:hypothetical protein
LPGGAIVCTRACAQAGVAKRMASASPKRLMTGDTFRGPEG